MKTTKPTATKPITKAKLAKKSTSTKKPDVIVIFKTESVNEPYIRYFTGLKVDLGLLVLFNKRKPVLFHSSLEKPPHSVLFDAKPFTIKELEKLFKTSKPSIVGYDAKHLSVAGLNFLKQIIKKQIIKKVTFKDVSKDLTKRTTIKTSDEIKNLTKAGAITQKIIDELIKAIPKMKFEDEAITFLRVESLQQGLELSFDPMVASGKNACNPHYLPKPKTPLQKGFCIIDFGVKYNGYCADISRTIYRGTPSLKEKEAYNQVLTYLLKLEKTIGSKTKVVKNPWVIPHALGHGIGLVVHEYPLVGKDKLEENMTIAVEPGLYTKAFGIRIEDNYVVQKNKLKRISVGNRELKIIKK